MAQITHLQNGNVIYNDKETEFYNLLDIIIQNI